MKAKVELTADDIREAIMNHVSRHFGITVPTKDITIEVKSKQNYRSEWEPADFRAHFDARVTHD